MTTSLKHSGGSTSFYVHGSSGDANSGTYVQYWCKQMESFPVLVDMEVLGFCHFILVEDLPSLIALAGKLAPLHEAMTPSLVAPLLARLLSHQHQGGYLEECEICAKAFLNM